MKRPVVPALLQLEHLVQRLGRQDAVRPVLQFVQTGRGQTAGDRLVQRPETFGQLFSQRLLAAVEDAFLTSFLTSFLTPFLQPFPPPFLPTSPDQPFSAS